MFWKHAKSELVFVDAVESFDTGDGNLGSTKFFQIKPMTECVAQAPDFRRGVSGARTGGASLLRNRWEQHI